MNYCHYCSAPELIAYIRDSKTCRYCNYEWNLEENDNSETYEQAAQLRNQGRFDDAMEMYDRLLNEKPGDTQARWGKLLCKYGVVYVEKEAENESEGTEKQRIITCFRRVASSFMEDYRQMDFGWKSKDDLQRKQDAEYITKIQNKLRQPYEPYDIFICYKQSTYDESGAKTHTEDSIRAEKLYKLLKAQGYRVFFAKEELSHNAAGSDYEVKIFNAIESAKVMLVLGTKQEYVRSTWMKNEWTRFLWIQNEYLMNNKNLTKELIPIIDFDFNHLPEKIGKLQGFEWQREEKSQYVHLRIQLDKFIPKTIPPYDGDESFINKEKVTKGLIFQQEGQMEEALRCFEQASRNGSLEAAYFMGSYYYSETTNSDYQAFIWFKKSAEGGFPEAMWQLSFMYEMGIGTKVDIANAKIWKQYYEAAVDSQSEHSV